MKKKTIIIAILLTILPATGIMAQSYRADSIRMEMEILLIDAQYKMDSLRIEANSRISELQAQYTDRVSGIQLEAAKRVSKLQITFNTKINDVKRRAEKNPFMSGKYERELSDCENEFSTMVLNIETIISDKVNIIEKRLDNLSMEIEREFLLQSESIEHRLESEYSRLETELIKTK